MGADFRNRILLERDGLPSLLPFNDMTAKSLNIVALMDVRLIKGWEDEAKKRIDACGTCPKTIVADFLEVNKRQVPVYKCGANGCKKSLDTKISLKEQQCPENKW